MSFDFSPASLKRMKSDAAARQSAKYDREQACVKQAAQLAYEWGKRGSDMARSIQENVTSYGIDSFELPLPAKSQKLLDQSGHGRQSDIEQQWRNHVDDFLDYGDTYDLDLNPDAIGPSSDQRVCSAALDGFFSNTAAVTGLRGSVHASSDGVCQFFMSAGPARRSNSDLS